MNNRYPDKNSPIMITGILSIIPRYVLMFIVISAPSKGINAIPIATITNPENILNINDVSFLMFFIVVFVCVLHLKL